MKYHVGQILQYVPDSKLEHPYPVTVIALRKRGYAKLSNGRIADEAGISEGTKSAPGGKLDQQLAADVQTARSHARND